MSAICNFLQVCIGTDSREVIDSWENSDNNESNDDNDEVIVVTLLKVRTKRTVIGVVTVM